MLRHLDLFSGIGGFALAVDRVFGESEHIFCDNDKFCRAVLKKHWPKSKIYGDIRTLTNTTGEGGELGGSTERNCSRDEERVFGRENCDIITGGFPCQPFSQAGKRKGTEDDRFLWPEMLRVIREFSPLWVIAENVRGILTINGGMVFEQVCLDLEGAGYEIQPFLIPAVSVNAPHRRDRVWFVAHRTGERCNDGSNTGEERHLLLDKGTPEENKQKWKGRECWACQDNALENAISERGGRRVESDGQILECECPEIENERPNWEKYWIEVATELCGMDDGLPAELDGLKLSASGHRKERLKSLGNSIVPQVAEEILKAIKKSYGTKTCLPSLQPRN